MPRTLLALLGLAVLAACKPEAPATPTAMAPGTGPGPHAAPPPTPAAEGATTYVSTATLLRREPSEARKVAGPGGKEVANVLATLQRGEKVTVAAEAGKRGSDAEWVKVRSSDDREGWIKRSSMLEGEGIGEATVLVPADVFDRPDLLAANAGRKLEPGTLLLVVRSRPPFSEVNVTSGPNAWVLSDRLATGDAEVSIAKLAEKARWLKRNGKPEEAAQILAFARAQFPGAPLLDLVATQLGEAPASEPGAAPAPGQPPRAPAPGGTP
jgi:hypothetical protein